ncbi:transposase (plasmid) [Alkalihalophilus sp. As8PL]|uniref:Transposase n=1 Tax=Alkalihalophilus sp. As8PL TaxID=3237103 RepID=A0AB39BN33_9BACI
MGKHHDREYKEHVAKLVVEEGRKISDLSYELEISYSTISGWVREYKLNQRREKGEAVHYTPSEVEKLKRQYDKELESLKEENEILKKAMHVFTKNQK